jgi:hypothetical protein
MIIQQNFELACATEIFGDAENPIAENYEMASSFPCICLSCSGAV